MPTLPPPEGHDGFHDVELGFTDYQAKEEAKRSPQCDLELRLAQRAPVRKRYLEMIGIYDNLV